MTFEMKTSVFLFLICYIFVAHNAPNVDAEKIMVKLEYCDQKFSVDVKLGKEVKQTLMTKRGEKREGFVAKKAQLVEFDSSILEGAADKDEITFEYEKYEDTTKKTTTVGDLRIIKETEVFNLIEGQKRLLIARGSSPLKVTFTDEKGANKWTQQTAHAHFRDTDKSGGQYLSIDVLTWRGMKEWEMISFEFEINGKIFYRAATVQQLCQPGELDINLMPWDGMEDHEQISFIDKKIGNHTFYIGEPLPQMRDRKWEGKGVGEAIFFECVIGGEIVYRAATVQQMCMPNELLNHNVGENYLNPMQKIGKWICSFCDH